MFYLDESGTISKNKPHASNMRDVYFIICFVHTHDPEQLKKVYRRTMKKLRRTFADYFATHVRNPREPKGSELTPIMKHYFISELIQKTDITVSYVVIDNRHVKDVFRENDARTFNFFVKYLLQLKELDARDQEHLHLNIDNRNVSLMNMHQLEEYLATELVLTEKVRHVQVEYLDSRDSYGVRTADLFANLLYQRLRYRSNPFPDYHLQDRIRKKSPIHPASLEWVFQQFKASGRLQNYFYIPTQKN